MKKIFYEKIGRRYKPVYEYDQTLMDSFSKGSHLVVCYPGGKSTHYNIDPAYAAMIAASRVAEDAICKEIAKASEVRPTRKALTEAERQAWNNLIDVWGDEARGLTRPCARDIAEAGIKAMQAEAEKLMINPAVKLAYDHFLMVCEITKKTSE